MGTKTYYREQYHCIETLLNILIDELLEHKNPTVVEETKRLEEKLGTVRSDMFILWNITCLADLKED